MPDASWIVKGEGVFIGEFTEVRWDEKAVEEYPVSISAVQLRKALGVY